MRSYIIFCLLTVISISEAAHPYNKSKWKAGHEEPCELNQDCGLDGLLVCRFGKCACPHPLNEDYDRVNGRCHTRVGAPCKLEEQTSGFVNCDRNTTCAIDPEADSPTGYTCQCGEGWIMNFDHDGCRKTYMSTCTTRPFPDYDNPECQVDVGLDCLEDLCQCKYFPDQTWDEKKSVCGSVLGAKCTRMEDLEDPPLQCLTGSLCSNPKESFWGHCVEGT